MKKLINPIIDLIYPDLCEICGLHSKSKDRLFCVKCLSHLPFTRFENKADNTFIENFKSEIILTYGIAIFYLNPGSGIAKLIHSLKYHNNPNLALRLGNFMGNLLDGHQLFEALDAIIPVPLHRKREKKRGFNQSERISFGMSQKTAIPVRNDILFREKNTHTQTSLSKFQRIRNTENAFVVDKTKISELGHVLLVDDVLTTGSTLGACASSIQKENENVNISMLTIALGE